MSKRASNRASSRDGLLLLKMTDRKGKSMFEKFTIGVACEGYEWTRNGQKRCDEMAIKWSARLGREFMCEAHSREEVEEILDARHMDHSDGYGYDDDFAWAGSALRAKSSDNPRVLPCPTCWGENLLTPKDYRLHYQCDGCADAMEGYGDYGDRYRETPETITLDFEGDVSNGGINAARDALNWRFGTDVPNIVMTFAKPEPKLPEPWEQQEDDLDPLLRIVDMLDFGRKECGHLVLAGEYCEF